MIEIKKCPFTRVEYVWDENERRVFADVSQLPDHMRSDWANRIGYMDTLNDEELDDAISFFMEYCGRKWFDGTILEHRANLLKK